jgi:hypothetical protein
MTREELEHIIRASADITNQYEFVIIGSQSMLGQIPSNSRYSSREIDGAIGEGSQFHETYGYYAQGVGPDTAVLPKDWMTRVHRVQNNNTNGRVGYCLDVLDRLSSSPS